MHELEDTRVLEICRAVEAAGGRAYLVGGRVRDMLLAEMRHRPIQAARDLDIEVYGLEAARLRELLDRFGRVDTVGESFTVYKLGDLDVSIPRRESKTGRGHKGFTVSGDPTMSVEEAARRRDFTINAILLEPQSGECMDPFNGRHDLEHGLLRAVDPATFVEDSLRVLRAMQFAARFEFEIEPATADLCRGIDLDDLPTERIWGEIEKLLLGANRPSIGLTVGRELGVVEKLFPELHALIGCEQEPDWHPEGDVWVHTLQCVDVARGLIDDLDHARALVVMLGTLCHDLGKPPTTEFIDGRIRSRGHEEAGVLPTARFLDRINVNSVDGFDVRGQILAIVATHLKPGEFYKRRDQVGDGAFRRLARKCEIDLLYRVAKADSLGRRADHAPPPDADAQEWFLERARALAVQNAPLPPILLGRHLLAMGQTPGPRIGRILDAIYELQMDGVVTTLDQAEAAARRVIEFEG